jgi:hypothetical protein
MSEIENGNRSRACGFCGDGLQIVEILLPGRFTAICDDCIQATLSSVPEFPESELAVISRSAELCGMCGRRGGGLRSDLGSQPNLCLSCIALAAEVIRDQGIPVSETALAWLQAELKRQKRARWHERWSRLTGLFGIGPR